MVVYWDLAALVNGAVDYLLLLGAARLAGRTVARKRLLAAALFGALYAAVQRFLPRSVLGVAAALAVMAALAFAGTGRAVKLGALFALLSCALGGAAVLLGAATGSLTRVARGLVYAELPWGVLLGSMGAAWLASACIFRGGARCDGGNSVTVRLTHGGRSVTLRLLHDSGNLLTDPVSGRSVPVIGASALGEIAPSEGYITLPCTTAVGAGSLRAFVCDSVCADGRELGRRLVAVSPELYGDGGFQGVWNIGAKEAGA